jgi:hypothetical protein
MQGPSPLPASAVWFDEEDLASKTPRRGNILLGALALSLEVLELAGKLVRVVATQTRIANEGIDVRSHEV